MLLYALQADEELAMHALFQGKHGVNRAVHAAAQQLDSVKLAQGIASIDEARAREVALCYLQANLSLDTENTPLPDTFLRSQVKISVLQIVNDNATFPYSVTYPEYDYMVTLQRPGVIMIAEVEYPRTYTVLQPILWHIKSAAEVTF